jgi:hypothetical protein
MAHPIRKLSFGEVFDQSFRLMREHFVTFSAGFVAAYVAIAAVRLPMLSSASARAALALLTIVAFIVVLPLVQLVVTIMAAKAYIGEPITFQNAVARAKELFLSYMGTVLLAMLGILGGFLLFIVPGIYLFTVWMLVAPIYALEGRIGSKALKRSRALVIGNFWRVLGAVTVVIVVGAIVSVAFEALFAFAPFAAKILGSVIEGLYMTYLTVLTVVLYIDLRCRHEDFDLQLLARAVERDRPPRGADALP